MEYSVITLINGDNYIINASPIEIFKAMLDSDKGILFMCKPVQVYDLSLIDKAMLQHYTFEDLSVIFVLNNVLTITEFKPLDKI